MRRYAVAALFAFGFLGSLASVSTAQPSSTKPAGSSAPVAASKDGGAPAAATTAPPSSTGLASSKDGGAAPVGSGPAVPIPDKPQMDGATYSVRLRDLEQRVDELKDQIRRSHTRLALLSDTIISGGAAGSRAEVVFKNEMSSAFRLTARTTRAPSPIRRKFRSSMARCRPVTTPYRSS